MLELIEGNNRKIFKENSSMFNIYSIKTALTWPSWEGLFVILAFPREVSIIADFISLFCLARKTFWGVSMTFLILTFWVFFVFGFSTFASSEDNRIVLVFPPFTLNIFLFVGLKVTCLSCINLSKNFFFL